MTELMKNLYAHVFSKAATGSRPSEIQEMISKLPAGPKNIWTICHSDVIKQLPEPYKSKVRENPCDFKTHNIILVELASNVDKKT